MDRFHDFVNQYERDHAFTIDEAALREVIEHKVKAEGSEEIKEMIRNYRQNETQ